MFHVHMFIGNKQFFNGRLQGIPRVGDTIRYENTMGTRYARVVEVVWCIDEQSDKGQRINIATIAIREDD